MGFEIKVPQIVPSSTSAPDIEHMSGKDDVVVHGLSRVTEVKIPARRFSVNAQNQTHAVLENLRITSKCSFWEFSIFCSKSSICYETSEKRPRPYIPKFRKGVFHFAHDPDNESTSDR